MKLNDFFDAAYYINLDRRVDRREQFESEMESIGLGRWAQRVPALPYFKGLHTKEDCDQCDKHAACGVSHVKILENASSLGLENVLILEDDITFTEGGLAIIEQALDQLNNIPDWDIFHLSAFIINDTLDLVSPNLIKANSCLTAHAYGVHKRAYDKLLAYRPTFDCPFDGWMGQRYNIQKYVAYPLAIYQREGASDLDASGKSIGITPYLATYDKPLVKLYE